MLVIIALQSSSGLVSNAKMMYIKATSHCLIRYQSIVGELCTIQSEDKFTQSVTQEQFDVLVNLRYHKQKLGKDIDDLIRTKSYDKTKWETAIRDLIGMSGDIKRASQLVELFNEGTYPSEII